MTGVHDSIEAVKRYYGQVLKSSADLKTSACCLGSSPPPQVSAVLNISQTRYAPHFRVLCDKATHFGLFDCGPSQVTQTSEAGAKAGCC